MIWPNIKVKTKQNFCKITIKIYLVIVKYIYVLVMYRNILVFTAVVVGCALEIAVLWLLCSSGMWTTFDLCGREADSVTLTTSEHSVFCVITRSLRVKPRRGPPSENWEWPLAWRTSLPFFSPPDQDSSGQFGDSTGTINRRSKFNWRQDVEINLEKKTQF